LRDILRQNNRALRHEIEQLQRTLNEARNKIPEELKAYSDRIVTDCEKLHQACVQNLQDLDLELDDLLKDILSNTQFVTRAFHFLNKHQVSPILRARESDRLCLKLLRWLHAEHEKTKDIPVALRDDEFSIWPIEPTIYFMPCTAQRGLLYLPLFFHEFGHLLYACHRVEMNELVRELQEAIADLLSPAIQRNDEYTQEQERSRNLIVETWYEWAQEIFCDAVGFVVGGSSFAYAFSMYLRMLGRGEYNVSREKLAHRSHPVTWIRIQLMANRGRQMGYEALASDLEETWSRIADAMGIHEDHDGFFDPAFVPAIQQKVNDMLTEAAPHEVQEAEAASPDLDSALNSPIALLNMAWQKFWDSPADYRAWEQQAIETFLGKR